MRSERVDDDANCKKHSTNAVSMHSEMNSTINTCWNVPFSLALSCRK